MPNKNYNNGAERERRIIRKYEKDHPGSICLRSAGSHSKIDCVMIDPKLNKVFLIQSKPRSMCECGKEKLELELKRTIYDDPTAESYTTKQFEVHVEVV